MIRFILKRRTDNSYGAVQDFYQTLDVAVPELEAALRRGGCNSGGPGYDMTDLVGVEIVDRAAPATEKENTREP